MKPHLPHPSGRRQAPDNAGRRTRSPHSPAVPDFTWSSVPEPDSCSSLTGQGPNTSPFSKWASPSQSCAGAQNDSSSLRSPSILMFHCSFEADGVPDPGPNEPKRHLSEGKPHSARCCSRSWTRSSLSSRTAGEYSTSMRPRGRRGGECGAEITRNNLGATLGATLSIEKPVSIHYQSFNVGIW